MSTVADYQGRLIDVMIFQNVQPTGMVQLIQSLAEPPEGGRICTGIQKLAQRWVLEFLTIQGSMQYLPARGTTFLAELQSGSVRTESDIQAAFLRAMVDLKKNLNGEELDTTPTDEQYQTATLLGITINPGGVITLSVNVLSQAGTARKVILPISVTAGV